jgi:toxin-antitoxin system PIN domain toxin
MIAVDTNLLVYAHREDSSWCEAARACLTDLAESGRPWAIPWPCLHEFLAVTTHPRIYRPPSRMEEALEELEGLLAAPSLRLIAEEGTTWTLLTGLLRASRVTGPKVHDARIVAICASHAVEELWSADRDFSRFKGLRIRNPLAST